MDRVPCQIVVLAWVLCGLSGSAVATEFVLPDGAGGGSYGVRPTEPELTEAERAEIRARIAQNVETLRAQGELRAETRSVSVLFTWPLRAANGLIDYGYHGIVNFVDQNPAFPNQLLDYNCGSRTYDTTSGYNHSGIDFLTTPFSWYKMARDQVEIIAAAPGTIVGKDDGNPDQSCGFGGGSWNAVYVMHEDGSVAWYGHMKTFSLTPKSVGATVERGEFLGVVGSSGNSTGPHLHFEVYDSLNNLIEPYAGTCNTLNPDSWWESQRPYYDSAVNEQTTGTAPPTFPPCPSQENPNQQTRFPRGATVYFTTYYRDQLDTQTSQYTIRRPDGVVYSQWTHNSNAPHYAWSYWYWVFNNFAPLGPDGLWRFEVVFEGSTYTRTFNIGGNPAGRVPGDFDPETPLTVSKAPAGDITLSWHASCLGTDTDYAIYEGSVGSYTSHVPIFCINGGATTRTFTPAAGSAYYLVAGRNATREGSLGYDGNGAERPAAASACLPRELGSCP